MQDPLHKDHYNPSGAIGSPGDVDEKSSCPTPDEPLIVARYFVIDSNGKKREMIRTRSGREIPVLAEDEAEEFFKKYTYADKTK